MVLADRLVVSGYAETKVAFILAQLVGLGMFFQAGQFQKETCAAVGEINQRERAVRRLFPVMFFQSQRFFVESDTAFQIGERTDDPLKMYAADICTVTVNIAGLPAISVPCGIAANGLPIGLQMIGPKFSEQMLFDTAGCFESLYGGFGVAPSVKA